jgi:hypothetical protein
MTMHHGLRGSVHEIDPLGAGLWGDDHPMTPPLGALFVHRALQTMMHHHKYIPSLLLLNCPG